MDRPGYTSQPPPKFVPPTQEEMFAQRKATQREHDHYMAKALPPIYSPRGLGQQAEGTLGPLSPSEATKNVAKKGRVRSALHRALSPRQWR